MPMTPADIDALLVLRSENEHLEFKAASRDYSFDTLVDYCVALANEGGGRILLGITDRAPRRVVGTKAFSVPERTVSGIHERIHIKCICDEVIHPDGRVLVFHVPSRPAGQPIHHAGRYLMRAGESLVPMTPDRLRVIVAEGEKEWSLLPSLPECDGQTVVDLLDTQGFFDLLRLPYPATRESVLARLADECVIEAAAKGWAITNLGAVLFAKDLNRFDLLARKAPRVVVYDGTNKLITKIDRQGSKGYAVGFQALVDFINGLVPTNEVIEQAIRTSVTMFPEIAVREVVANALIHQDYTMAGASVMVELYEDRMEVSSPGVPFIPPERFIDGYRSRNERIADLMRRMGICEEKGSGIDKVVHAAEAYQLPAPDFRGGQGRTSVVLFRHKNFEDMDRDDRIRATYQHCCLRFVMNEKMTNQSLRERFQLTEKKAEAISRAIRDTVEAGIIKLADPTQTSLRYRRYIPHWA